MFRWAFCLLWSLAQFVVAGRRSAYAQFQLIGINQRLELRLGTPEQKPLTVAVSTLLSDLVVVDERCGRRDWDCPQYCGNSDFSDLYCSAKCQPISTHGVDLLCGVNSGRYRPEDSRSAEKISDWRGRVSTSRRLAGEIFTDQIVFSVQSKNNLRDNSKRVNMSFISATMFDKRLIIWETNGMLGLRPGPGSAIAALCRELEFENVFVTLARTRLVESILRPINESNSELFLTIGALDRVRCVDWEWMDAVSPEHWVVEFAFIDFMGKVFENVTVSFESADAYLIIDSVAANHLLEIGILQKFIHNGFAQVFNYTNCDHEPNIGFLDRNRRPLLEFGGLSLIFGGEKCAIAVITDNTDLFTFPRYSRIWRMGFPLFWQHCLAFDYKSHRVGFGRRRDRAAQLY